MGFVVYHKKGMKDKDYLTYLRLLSRRLLQRGADLTETPRVRENGAGQAWLYVWDDEEDARAFAAEMADDTRDPDWGVRAVKGSPSRGPLRPLDIGVGRQGGGWTFGLEPMIRAAVVARFPDSCRHPSVFIASESREAFAGGEDELRGIGAKVLSLLTGLSAEQLRPFGTYRLMDPVDYKEFLPPTPIA